MGKIEDKKKQKQIALLRSAYTLFVEKGVEHTTVLEIALKAGMAKGTFYLYYKDKYEVRDALTFLAASVILKAAIERTQLMRLASFEDNVVSITDQVVRAFEEDKDLLRFISKNLSWGLFQSALSHPVEEEQKALLGSDFDAMTALHNMIEQAHVQIDRPDCLLFMIVELIGSTCISTILQSDPVSIDTFKPHLFSAIRGIVRSQIVQPASVPCEQGALA